jgi:hypothetical protein
MQGLRLQTDTSRSLNATYSRFANLAAVAGYPHSSTARFLRETLAPGALTRAYSAAKFP